MPYTTIRQFNAEFRTHWWNYVLLFTGISIGLEVIFIPFFRLLATYLLHLGQVPVFTLTNITMLITQHPLVSLALVGELLLILIIGYWQFAFLLLGIQAIQQRRFSFGSILGDSWWAVRRLRLAALLVLLGYILLLLPGASFVFKTQLFAKVHVPGFILDFIFSGPLMATAYSVLFIGAMFIGLRLVYVLPLLILDRRSTSQSIKTSWQMTSRGQWWVLLKQILGAALLLGLMLVAVIVIVIIAQVGWDRLPQPFPLYLATVGLTIMEVGHSLLGMWFSVVTLSLVAAPFSSPGYNFSFSQPPRGKMTSLVVGALIILGLLAIPSNYFYLKNSGGARPLLISHRGVDDHNGVQNTIPALKRTAKEHPDYVEMDIHETKDHQFVVMHDENLKKLTGVNKKPHDLTLAQLTRLTAREYGHEAPVASFDQYLTTAEKLHQKLLVEIKTTPADSPQLVHNFLTKYARRLQRDHYELHSLDYGVVQQVRHQAPTLKIGYIQPYNLTYPNTNASFYSMEYSTLDDSFILLSELHHQPVYAWTVNSSDSMQRMLFLGVNGVITDNLSELRSELKDYHDPNYTMRILNYLNNFEG